MTTRGDDADRLRALTALDATLLVEAAAGTGKTSLLAGRVTMLLASGVVPSSIAAITFTELAAGELRARVERFVTALLNDVVPADIAFAVGTELSAPQKAALAASRPDLDALTATTIHGFCHALLRSYAAEANIDPGANVLEAVQTDFAFASVFERWLRRRLGENANPEDPVAVMARRDPAEAVDTLMKLGSFRRAFRTARPLEAALGHGADAAFVDSVREFRRWLNGVRYPDKAQQDMEGLERLAAFYEGAFAAPPSFARLWDLAHPPRIDAMVWRSFALKPYQRLGAWKSAAGREDGPRLAAEAGAHYDRCAAAFSALFGGIATTLVASFSGELDELLADFETFKRDAAVLDFDDLLLRTRELLRTHETVRRAASERYARILVDEFQDTDSVQAEILFLIGSVAGNAPSWQQRALRTGSLFMVGDPKQAIYRFRGADVASYMTARDAVERQFPGNILRITASFRSREDILQHINLCFRDALGRQAPGYVTLESTLGPPEHSLPCVAKVTVRINERSKVDFVRDEEARTIAALCARLIGNIRVRRSGGQSGLLVPGDIALLAPAGTDLWRYERALEEEGLPLASQAGRSLFRRQEAQDFVALVRALADPRDTVALGALLRGPLVGLSEQALLDITAFLPPGDRDAGSGRLTLFTPPEQIGDEAARAVMAVLLDLRRRVRTTTPFLLLAEALERLRVRATLAARGADQAARTLANLDLLMERARGYGVRGFRQFARDLNADWRGGPLGPKPYDEARLDASGEAIEIVTVHSAKGLEWPVVIPVNMGSELRRRDAFIYRRHDDTLHWVLGDVVPPAVADAIGRDDQESSEERERLLYVACTRAIDLLILPQFSAPRPNSWTQLLDLRREALPELDLSGFTRQAVVRAEASVNAQTAEVFAAERATADAASRPIRWIRPSADDPDRLQPEEAVAAEIAELESVAALTAGSRARGIILHKLMEEVLTGEVLDDACALHARSAALCEQLVSSDRAARPDPAEMASTASRTLRIPAVAEWRAVLIPELPLYAACGDRLTAGRADAAAYADGRPAVVFDWKSDVAPTPADRADYAAQLTEYLNVIGARRGAVVFMTLGQVQWVESGG